MSQRELLTLAAEICWGVIAHGSVSTTWGSFGVGDDLRSAVAKDPDDFLNWPYYIDTYPGNETSEEDFLKGIYHLRNQLVEHGVRIWIVTDLEHQFPPGWTPEQMRETPTSPMNVVEKIREIVECLRASSAADELTYRIDCALSRLPGVESDRHIRHRISEYEIVMGHRSSVEGEAEILRWLRPLEIASAPETVETIALDNRSVLVVRRYWSCPGERVLPVDDTNEAFIPAQWDRFRRDMAKLVEHGKIHPYARGTAHVLVSASSGTILLNTWPVLKNGTEREKRDFLQSIENIPRMRLGFTESS